MGMYEDMPPSEVVQTFLDWLGEMQAEQAKCWEVVETEDSKVQDFLHEIEFESNSKKRALIDTRLHTSRVNRRAAKDRAIALKPIKEFIADATNRGFIKRLKKLQSDLKAQEEYLAGERTYKPRAKDGGANESTCSM